jgi:predicted Zn-ribbon and HTH transcriptional regulator
MLEEKNIQSKKYQLGQFFTPVDMVKDILSQIEIDSDIIIEPSFGGCGFIELLVEKFPDKKIVGVELDEEWFLKGKERFPNLELHHSNFYDIPAKLVYDTKKVSFVGNVPFRSPAYSLTTHPKYVKQLSHKYEVTGIREEAVFFIIQTADIMITNEYEGGIHYIIPKSLVTNDSKFYKQFKLFLKKYFKIVSVLDVDPSKFDNVAQGLIVLSITTGGDDSNYLVNHNGIEELVDSVIQLENPDIPFQKIFKKTYLGSVPAESFLLSAPGETQEKFKDRLVKIFNNKVTALSLKIDLMADEKYHLKILSSKDTNKVDAKLEQIAKYINNIKLKIKDFTIFNDLTNYPNIQHRKGTRFYFRNTALKNCGFVYELNPNPRPSFYFTSNPSAGSTDYFGYCDYDITRTSSPGCCRTIPLKDVENNLTDDFKEYWNANTNNLPYVFVYNYIKYVAESSWYKEQKRLRKRFYFCIPTKFVKEWLVTFTKEKQKEELAIIEIFLEKEVPVKSEVTKPVKVKTPKVKKENPLSPLFEEV